MEKFATKEGAKSFHQAQKNNPDKVRQFDELSLSALAVGTYLGASDETTDRQYEEALVLAAQNGVNFFDTAINYRCQRSERNIAYALRKLAGLGIHRDQVFISTKGGFLPADSDPNEFQPYVYKHFLNTGLITPEDIVANCHCMKPEFIATMITMSLNNLKVDSIDLYYLHNPEMQLEVLGEEAFYQKLAKVFEVFESKVQEGKIKRYGVATWNGFRQARGFPDLLDLNRILQTAKDVAGDKHHFNAIQLPYNLAMMEAVAIQNQKIGEEDFPVVPTAVHNGIGIFVSAPLMQSKILNLPQEFYDQMPGQDETPMQKALQFVASSPGVVSAMVGMKSKAHVEENLKVLKLPNWQVSDLQNVAKMLVPPQ